MSAQSEPVEAGWGWGGDGGAVRCNQGTECWGGKVCGVDASENKSECLIFRLIRLCLCWPFGVSDKGCGSVQAGQSSPCGRSCVFETIPSRLVPIRRLSVTSPPLIFCHFLSARQRGGRASNPARKCLRASIIPIVISSQVELSRLLRPFS